MTRGFIYMSSVSTHGRKALRHYFSSSRLFIYVPTNHLGLHISAAERRRPTRLLSLVLFFCVQTWRPLRGDWPNTSPVCSLQPAGGEVSPPPVKRVSKGIYTAKCVILLFLLHKNGYKPCLPSSVKPSKLWFETDRSLYSHTWATVAGQILNRIWCHVILNDVSWCIIWCKWSLLFSFPVILIVVSVCTATGAWNWLIDPDTQKVRLFILIWDIYLSIVKIKTYVYIYGSATFLCIMFC